MKERRVKCTRAELRAISTPHDESTIRYVIIKSVKGKIHYYNGDHFDGPWTWCHKKAMLYAHMSLVINDLMAIQHGALPEGRRHPEYPSPQ